MVRLQCLILEKLISSGQTAVPNIGEIDQCPVHSSGNNTISYDMPHVRAVCNVGNGVIVVAICSAAVHALSRMSNTAQLQLITARSGNDTLPRVLDTGSERMRLLSTGHEVRLWW